MPTSDTLVVNLDSRIYGFNDQKFSVDLSAGRYRILPISPPSGGFYAYNAWGSGEGRNCDGLGENCSVDGHGLSWRGAPTGRSQYHPSRNRRSGPGNRGGTRLLRHRNMPCRAALPNQRAGLRKCSPDQVLVLPSNGTIDFYTGDSTLGDNSGGMSFEVRPEPTTVSM